MARLNSVIWEIEDVKYEVWFDDEFEKFYFKKVGEKEEVQEAVESLPVGLIIKRRKSRGSCQKKRNI